MKADYRYAPPPCAIVARLPAPSLHARRPTVVDGDAQRLKHARCRMDAFPLSGALQDSRIRAANSEVVFGKPLPSRRVTITRAMRRAERSSPNAKKISANSRSLAVDKDVVGAVSASGIHPHVEDRGLSEREAALRIVKLTSTRLRDRRECRPATGFRPGRGPTELAKVGVHEGQTGVGKLLRHRTRARVGVQCRESAVRPPAAPRSPLHARPPRRWRRRKLRRDESPSIRAPAPRARERGSAQRHHILEP